MRTNNVFILGVIFIFTFFSNAEASLSYVETYQSSQSNNQTAPSNPEKILVLVKSDIYDAIYNPSLKQYVEDLEAEGYYVILNKFTSGTSMEIRDYLRLISGLKGVVFVGDITAARIENIKNAPNEVILGDIFYMKLDGEWRDTNSNGLYDTLTSFPPETYTPNFSPEIWVSRISASNIYRAGMDQAAMIRNYFYKNHSYRSGSISNNKNALEYLNNYIATEDRKVSLAYPARTRLSDGMTSAADYRLKLVQNFEWLHLAAHSWPQGHQFLSGGTFSYFYSNQVPLIEPKILFYYSGGCNSCKFDEKDYVGGHYLFSRDSGILVIGPTKPATDLAGLSELYTALGPNFRESIGEATQKRMRILTVYWDNFLRIFGSSVILGDGTLTLDPPIAAIVSINPSTALPRQTITCTGAGSIANGSITGYAWRSSKDGFLSNQRIFSSSALSQGQHFIYFKVKDSHGRWSSEAKRSIQIQSNLPPTASSAVYSMNEDNSLAIVLKAQNSNTQPLTFKISSVPAHGVLRGAAPNLTYQPASNWSGTDYFYFNVSDGSLVSPNAKVTITVAAVNDAPVLSVPSLRYAVKEKTALSFAIKAADVDGDGLLYNAAALPPGGTFNAVTRIFQWTPGATSKPLTYYVSFEATDIKGGIDRKTVKMTSLPSKFDINADGSINITDVMTLISRIHTYDLNKDRSFSFDDVNYFLSHMNTANVTTLDLNKNGRIDFADIIAFYYLLPAYDLNGDQAANQADIALLNVSIN